METHINACHDSPEANDKPERLRVYERVIKDDAEENRLFSVCFTISRTPLILT